MASWVMWSTPDQVACVCILAGDTVLCSQPSHLTLTVLLSPPRCMNGATSKFNGDVNLQKQDELWPG